MTEATESKLTEIDAIEIWIAKWLKIKIRHIYARYDVNPRRLYEIWQEIKFIGTRETAKAMFKNSYPELIKSTDFSPHKPKNRVVSKKQRDFFEDDENSES